jgi:hypothetical protein
MHRSFRALTILTAVAVTAGTAMAKTFVLPHILEKSGTISNSPNTFDTQVEITYARGLVDGKTAKGATASLYLYDSTGALLVGAGGATVCGPCEMSLGGSGSLRKVSVRIDDLITAKGGFASPQEVVTGFGVLVVNGDDKNVAVQGFVVNSHTGPFDLSFLPIPAEPVK